MPHILGSSMIDSFEKYISLRNCFQYDSCSRLQSSHTHFVIAEQSFKKKKKKKERKIYFFFLIGKKDIYLTPALTLVVIKVRFFFKEQYKVEFAYIYIYIYSNYLFPMIEWYLRFRVRIPLT